MRSKRTIYATVHELSILWGKEPEDWDISGLDEADLTEDEEVRLHYSDRKESWMLQRSNPGREGSVRWYDAGALHKNDIPSEEQVKRI